MVPNVQFSKLELMQGRVEFIPDDWDFVHLKKAFKICNNLRLPISEDERLKNPGPYPYYGPTKVQGYIANYQQDGDYALIGEDGDHFLKYKSIPMTQLVSGKCTVNNHAHVIQGTKKATREWFYYYFMYRDIFSFLSRQGAGRYKLNKAALENLPILVPPRPEQQKIAQILSTWDKAIEKLEVLIAVKQKRKKTLMQQLLTGRRRFDGFEGEWKEVKLGDVGTISSAGVDKKIVPREPEVRLLNFLDVFKRSFIFNSEIVHRVTAPIAKISKCDVKKGDIFFTPSSETREELAISAVAMEDMPGVVYSYHIVRLRLHENWDLKFRAYVFQSDDFYRQAYFLGDGSGQRYVISQDNFRGMSVKIPSHPEQRKIGSILSAVDKEIETHQKQLVALKEQKKGLMQQLLTGKKRVKVGEAV